MTSISTEEEPDDDNQAVSNNIEAKEETTVAQPEELRSAYLFFADDKRRSFAGQNLSETEVCLFDFHFKHVLMKLHLHS